MALGTNQSESFLLIEKVDVQYSSKILFYYYWKIRLILVKIFSTNATLCHANCHDK